MYFMEQTPIELIVKVDSPDKSIGSVGKWEAHKKGILHIGITLSDIVHLVHHRVW